MLPNSAFKSFGVPDASLSSDNDEEERRSVLSRTASEEVLMIKNEKKNEINSENVWSLSVIDTSTDFFEHKHNFSSNFRVACSSLEASSKVHGLRVDSNYRDVVRISAGLAKSVNSKNAGLDDIDDVYYTNDQTDIVNKSVGETQPDINANPPKPKNRARRQISTVTRNKESLNGLLKTIPMDDVIFSKLNRIGGAINSSKCLMHNVLPTRDYDLKLSTKFNYWTAFDNEEIDYTLEMEGDALETDVLATESEEILNEETDLKNSNVDKSNFVEIKEEADNSLLIRSLYTDYPLYSKDKIKYKDKKEEENTSSRNVSDLDEPPRVLTPSELVVQFDMDAECDPVCLDPKAPMLDIDLCEYDAITLDEITAINRCGSLRRSAQIMEDLRPIDSSQLEYSYRELNNIQNCWIGPSNNSNLRETMANKSAGTIANSVIQLDDEEHGSGNDSDHPDRNDVDIDSESQECNDTVLKIGTEFDGPPSQVTKIVVPFAKRTRHFDMKNLITSCKSLVDLQFKVSAKEKEDNKKGSEQKENNDHFSDEKYIPGEASFKEMYESLPEESNASASTPIMSFFSLLHLASENNLRLSENADDIIIRKIQTQEQMKDNDTSNS
ncbi:uncharacterized protein LOC119662550 [Teleopsis dalmanni]|uniref:uncharacterized protein LOC119662550 n=1 Tax=Teleopsis dalmanni TaxID=139649 RepID=UPI0018CC9999|nr:uncharacterized protein LOC119662550 [Teleopsis dalmanni]